MPRARLTSSQHQQKPTRGNRFKVAMQMSTHSPTPKDGFAGLPSNREFDLWLQRELSRLHGDVLHEPVPEKLLSILEGGAGPRD